MEILKIGFIDKEILLIQGIVALMNSNNISGFNNIGHFTSLSEYLEDCDEDCNLIITDLNIEDDDVVDHVPRIKKKNPNCRVIVLTNYDNYKLVRDMMKAGADGYLLKKSSFGELIKCIEEVMDGHAHIGNGLKLTPSRKLFNSKEEEGSTEENVIRKYEDRFQVRQKLTKRELEILKLITQAKTNKEIGTELFISDQTVGVHKKNIMRKLNVRSTISLIKYAMEQNLV